MILKTVCPTLIIGSIDIVLSAHSWNAAHMSNDLPGSQVEFSNPTRSGNEINVHWDFAIPIFVRIGGSRVSRIICNDSVSKGTAERPGTTPKAVEKSTPLSNALTKNPPPTIVILEAYVKIPYGYFGKAKNSKHTQKLQWADFILDRSLWFGNSLPIIHYRWNFLAWLRGKPA